MSAVPSTLVFSCTVFLCDRSFSQIASSLSPLHRRPPRPPRVFTKRRIRSEKFAKQGASPFLEDTSCSSLSSKLLPTIPRCSGSSNISSDKGETSNQDKIPFGYTRKDVILIGLGLTVAGIGLKTGLEYLGVDPLQAGNVVQLVLVLGLTVGWISTYIFRVSNKEMTYAQQLRDYEDKVMQKRLESLTEAEIEALLEQVEEEKRQLERRNDQQVK